MTDLNITPSETRAGYDPEKSAAHYAANSEGIKNQYHYEKWLGKRKSNGSDKLKSLNPMHKQIVASYINGMKGVEIAEDLDIAAITVYRVLSDPLVTPMIEEFDERFRAEFKAMFPLVADAVRDGLSSPSTTTRLKAVDRWARICKVIDGDDEGSGNQIESITTTRVRLVQMIKEAIPPEALSEGALVIEAEVKEVVRSA